jgi:hypothetical protein
MEHSFRVFFRIVMTISIRHSLSGRIPFPDSIKEFAMNYLALSGKPLSLEQKMRGFISEMESGATKIPTALEELIGKIAKFVEEK